MATLNTSLLLSLISNVLLGNTFLVGNKFEKIQLNTNINLSVPVQQYRYLQKVIIETYSNKSVQ